MKRETPWDPDWFGPPDPAPAGDRRSDIMRDVLESLSEEDQFLAFARIYEQLSFRELGDRLGLSHEAARKRWARIEGKIRREYLRRTAKVTFEHPEHGLTVEVKVTDEELMNSYIDDGWRITWER